MRVLIVAALLLLSFLPARADALFEVKGWVGQAYFQKDGKLSFCEAATSYTGGDRIIFLMWPDLSLSIVYETGVKFRKGRKYATAVFVDGQRIASGYGIGAARGSLLLALPSTRLAFSRLYNGSSIQIKSQASAQQSYTLNGSAAALMKLKECVEVASQLPSSPPGQQSASASPQPPAGPGMAASGEPQTAGKFPKDQLLIAASQILNEMGIAGWSFVDPQLVGNLGDVAWKYNGGGLGAMTAFTPQANKTMEEAIALITASDSLACTGKLLTSMEPIKTTATSRTKRIETVCQSSTGETLKSGYTIIERPDKAVFVITDLTAHDAPATSAAPQGETAKPAGDEL